MTGTPAARPSGSGHARRAPQRSAVAASLIPRAVRHRELVTVVGHSASTAAGEWITATGEWVNDRTHGQQFKARFLRTSAPTSTEGIEKYLSSGMIRGIGPVYARKLVRALSEKVFDVIEAERDRLREVDGIGPVRAQQSGMQRCRSAVGPVSGAFPAASSGMQSSLACSTREGPTVPPSSAPSSTSR